MQKIEKDFSQIPAGLASENCKQKKAAALAEKNGHDFAGSCYGHDSVKMDLAKIYHSKCAFCESNTLAGASLQVEHFRPKGNVKEAPLHGGYYWLGYEWTNLLYACSKCNRHKSTYFPVQGVRQTVPIPSADGTLNTADCHIECSARAGEDALLLNPETTDPRKHLCFDHDGNVGALSIYGEKSIEIYDLQRQPLVLARKTAIDVHFHLFREAIENHANNLLAGKAALIEILSKHIIYLMEAVCDPKQPYRQALRAMFVDFENFAIVRFPAEYQGCLRESYRAVVGALKK